VREKTALSKKVMGIKGHEETHVTVEEPGSRVVWLRIVDLDHDGNPRGGTQTPLTPGTAKELASNLHEAADQAAQES